jgi:hypothetical protein
MDFMEYCSAEQPVITPRPRKKDGEIILAAWPF